MPITKLAELTEDVRSCRACPLHRKCKRRTPGVGRGSARVMFVGQAGGWEEDREGIPWVGQAGQWLSALVERMGLKDADLFWTNLVKCYPGRKRMGGDNEPPAYAIEACQKWLIDEIRLVDPELIVAVGAISMRWFGIKGGINQNNGRIFDTKYGRVIPVLHPAGIFRRMSEAPALRTSLHAILTHLNGPAEVPPFVDAEESAPWN